MATGLPVVATDVEGVTELLGPEASAQTVAYGDSDALCKAIVGFLTDPAKANALGRRNRARAETAFTLARMVDGYQALWESLAAV